MNWKENNKKNRKNWKEAQKRALDKYYEKNAERIAEMRRVYREKNKEKKREYNKEYSKRPGVSLKKRLSNKKRIERLGVTNDGSVTKNAIEGMLVGQGYMCKMCKADLRIDYHIDHIYPVSKGGAHSITNIQLLCPKCNLTKKDKILV